MSELIHTEKFALIHDPFIAIIVEPDDFMSGCLRISQNDHFLRIAKKDVDLLIEALTRMRDV